MSEQTRPTAETRQSERHEAHQAPEAGAEPTPEEEEAADKAVRALEESGASEDVGEHYRDMTERGVRQKGEGQVP